MRHRHLPKHRFVFIGFLLIFGSLTGLFLIGLGVVYWLSTKNFPAGLHPSPERFSSPLVCLIPILFLLLAGIIGRLAFRRYAKPFAEIMAATDAVSRGDLDVRMSEQGPKPSLREMASSFNNMTGELARVEQQRRNMTADIAHELRTPLHIIQGNIEGMLDGVYEPTSENLGTLLDETRLLARLVTDLQTLSLSEAGQLPLHPTRFPIADLLADVVTSFSAHAAEQGVDLNFECDPGISLFADYDRLDQVLSNLVTNSLRAYPGRRDHPPPGRFLLRSGPDHRLGFRIRHSRRRIALYL